MPTDSLDRISVGVRGTTWLLFGAAVAALGAAVALGIGVDASRRVDHHAGPVAPLDLSQCDWMAPNVWCRLKGPPDLEEVPTASTLVDELWVLSARAVQVGEPLNLELGRGVAIRAPVGALPDVDELRAEIPDAYWFEAQQGLPATDQIELDYDNEAFKQVYRERREWRKALLELERERRQRRVARHAVQEHEQWRERTREWDAIVASTHRMRTLAFAFGLLGAALFPLFALAAYHYRRLRIEVACTRTHLYVDGEAVLLTELPDDPLRLEVVVRGLLPPGYRFGPDADGFFAALARAVHAQHGAEERPEARARLENLASPERH